MGSQLDTSSWFAMYTRQVGACYFARTKLVQSSTSLSPLGIVHFHGKRRFEGGPRDNSFQRGQGPRELSRRISEDIYLAFQTVSILPYPGPFPRHTEGATNKFNMAF